MPYQKPGQRESGQGTDYRAQSNPVYCEKEEFFPESLHSRNQSNRAQMRREEG